MQLKYFLAASAASLSLACGLAATPVMAQETTSSIDGTVTGDAGAVVSGAKVTVRHVPSGTVSTTVTDAGGSYSLRGLRVGGPYTVTVSADKYSTQTFDGVSLSVGETLGLPLQLGEHEIVVSGQRERSRELVTSSQSSFNAEEIQNLVSSRRDVRDIIRKDLLSTYNANVGGVSIAGGNIRTQRFSVDGVAMQDSFGLNYGGLPSSRGIVSIEAIDQLTVKAAPFDISEGNFQGGAVNVVLKSGTNLFHGSAFGNFGGPKQTGKRTADNIGVVGDIYPVADTRILDFRNYGGSLSGPIIKDTLFFSFAYEKLTEGTPNGFGVQGSQASNLVPNVFYADTPSSSLTLPANAYPFGVAGNPTSLPGLKSVFTAFTANYGTFAIGDVPTAIAETDKKYSGKIDWNITSGQRFSASFIHHENVLPNFGAAGSTSTTAPFIALQSDLYRLTEFTNAATAQLNSQWSDKFSTEVRASYKYYKRGQDGFSGPDYAQFNVCLDPTSQGALAANAGSSLAATCSLGSPIVRLGPDTPRQANAFNNKILTIQANAALHAGDHTFKLEYDNMHSQLYNLFVFGTGGLAGTGGPQGLYYFDSFRDFQNKQANELILNSTTVGPKTNGYVAWAYTTHSVGLQDTWKISPSLVVNYGLRYDLYDSGNPISPNANFANRFANIYPNLTNTATLNGRQKLQPRFGFNWQATDNLRVVGGVGLFAGGLSDVFISNNYSNSGASLNSTGTAITGIDIFRTTAGCVDRTTGLNPGAAVCTAALNGIDGANVPGVVTQYLQTNTGVLANATTNSLDPKFKIPAQWKYDLSFNWRPDLSNIGMGSGWTIRADALYSKAQQAIRWIDLRAQPLFVNGVAQVAPDGRTRYGGTLATGTGVVQPGSNSDIQLTNTTQGRSIVLAAGINKEFDWLSVSAGYTWQNVKDVAGALVSSTVGSSYGIPTSSPNSGGDYGRSAFEVRSTLRAAFEVHHKFFGDNETRLGIGWERRSGTPFSATMNDFSSAANGRASVFGTVNNTAHLLYVPDFNLTPTTTASTTQGVAGGLTQYGNVIFADAATLTAMQALVNGTALKGYQGRIAPKNLLTGPKYDQVNLHFSQQLPLVFGAKLTGLFSIENFLNLLNRNWGSYQEFGNTAVVRVVCQTAAAGSSQVCPAYVYSAYSAPRTTTYAKASLWTIRAGARLTF